MSDMSKALQTVLELHYNNKDSIKNTEDLYQLCSDEGWIGECANLVNHLMRSINCRVESFMDLQNVLCDLYHAYNDYTACYGYGDSESASRILYWWDSKKYGYADEHDRFWKMQIITDSDFIPYKSLSNQEYHLIYDVLYNDDNAYDVVATYYNEMKTPIGRKVALKHWVNLFQNIIDTLNWWKEKSISGDVCIYIPFLDEYRETASHTIELFNMAIDTANLLRDTDGSPVEIEHPDKMLRVDDMKKEFQDWMDNVVSESEEESVIIYDEMIRRGFFPNTKPNNKENLYRTDIIGVEVKETPAEQLSAEEVKEQSIKNRTAVIYYMLQDKVDARVIHKLAHYVCKPNAEFKGANASDTIYTYISHPNERFLDKTETIDYLRKTLQKYKFDDDYINKNIK